MFAHVPMDGFYSVIASLSGSGAKVNLRRKVNQRRGPLQELPPLNRHAVEPGGLNKSGEPRGWGGTGGRYVAKDDVGKEVPVGTWCLMWATLRTVPEMVIKR